jgi:ABC-type lipoprotein release transport system permease subunit
MRTFLAVAQTGVVSVVQYPLRSAATVGCVLAVLFPYVAGLGLSHGIRLQAQESVRLGADLYVTGQQFGREVPVPVRVADELRQIDGVTAVVPRIVARVVLGKEREEAVLVGLPPSHFPPDVTCVEGELPRTGSLNELVLGTELARRLGLHVDSLIPPFYHSRRGDRLSKVVGLFASDAAPWQANLIFTTFDTAATICDQEGLATDILVSCRPGYHDAVRAAMQRTPRPDGLPALRVATREDVEALLPRGVLHREGIFNLHYVLAFSAGILTILVTSGFGTSERRREVGILKATGWQTDEILLRGLVESFLLSLVGAALAVILAFAWLWLLNGYWIASVFLAGVDTRPGFRVPFRLAPVPMLLAFLIAAVVVLSGTLYSTWRAAVVPPREAMR